MSRPHRWRLGALLAALALLISALPAHAQADRPKLDRKILAPRPDNAIPSARGMVSPAHIVEGGWQHCALTFDDGPNEITPRILAILAEHGVTATFFPVASAAAASASVIRSMIAAGHEIGNHSHRHANLLKMSPAARRADLAEANRVLEGLGARPTLFRPPYAAWDNETVEIARSVGLETVLWSLDTRDWETRDAGMLAARVNAGAGPALVVLLHATYDWTARALPEIITALRGHGCRFVTVSDWLAFMRNGIEAPTRPIPVAARAAAPPAVLAPAVVETPAVAAPPPPLFPHPAPPVPQTAAIQEARAMPETEPAPPPVPPPVVAAEAPPAAPVMLAQSPPVPPPAPAAAPAPPPAPSAAAARPAPARAAPAPKPAAPAPARAVAPPPAARPAAAPAVLTLRPATLARGANNQPTVLRIEGDDVFLQLGPDADLDAIAAQLKAALDRPRQPR